MSTVDVLGQITLLRKMTKFFSFKAYVFFFIVHLIVLFSSL